MWSKVLQNAQREHSVILLTFIKLPFVFKTFVLAIFEWPLKTGFTTFIMLLKFGLNSILFDQSPLHKYNIIEVGSVEVLLLST